MTATASPARLSRHAILVVASAALIVTIAMGVRQAFGLMLRPVSMDLDVGRQTFGLAIAVSNLIFGLAQPFVGAYADRHGAGRVVAVGTLVYVAGLIVTAAATGALDLQIGMGLLVGLGLSGTTFVVVLGAVARAVPPEKRSLAFGIATAGGSLGQFLVVPGAQLLLDLFDWQGALLALAALTAVAGVLALGVAGRPEPRPEQAGEASSPLQAVREAFQDRNYWLLNAGFFVCGFHIAFVATHLPAFINDQGLAASVGAAALAAIGLFNIAGSWLFGAWGGRYPKKTLLSALYAGRAVAIAVFLLVPISPLSVVLFAAVFGFLWLGTVPLTSGLVATIWGVRNLSTLYGVVFLSHQLGSFLGAWSAGAVFDATGSYLPVWLASIALGIGSALIHLPIREAPAARPAGAVA